MKSYVFAVAGLLSLVMFASSISARKDSGEYWRQVQVLKDDKPQFAQGTDAFTDDFDKKKSNCDHGSAEPSLSKYKRTFTDDFEPRPNVSAYTNGVKSEDDISFAKDFEPRPSATAYTDDVKPEDGKSFIKDFSVTAYTDAVKPENDKLFAKDFEPRPNLSAYAD